MGASPLVAFCKHRIPNIVNPFLFRTELEKVYDNSGQAALHVAAGAGNPAILRILLQAGANAGTLRDHLEMRWGGARGDNLQYENL